MEEQSRQNIRRLLKSFGIQADEAISAHLAQNPDLSGLKIRFVLEDLTDYGDNPPAKALGFEIEGEI